MGSGFFLPGLVWDQGQGRPWDGAAGTLGQTPPVRAWLCWGLSVGVGSWAGEWGALLCLGAALLANKSVMFVGKSGSSPSPSSTSNQTCFLSFSSAYGEALHCQVMLLDS